MTRVNSIAVLASVAGLDQLTKYFAFRVIKNPGLPFGIDLGGKDFLEIGVIIALLAIFILLYAFYFRRLSLGFVLIVSGALSNLADRIYLGAVRDFIDVGIATMNIADLAVWTGIVMLLFSIRISNYSNF